jgi:hypothetical protein
MVVIIKKTFLTAILLLIVLTTGAWQSHDAVRAASQNRSVAETSVKASESILMQTATFGKTTPANGATNVDPASITFSWQAYSPTPDSYSYCVKEGSACAANDPRWTRTGLNRSVTLTNFANGKTYYWQVRAIFCGNCVPKTFVYADGGTVWTFTTRVAQVTILGNAGVSGAVLSYTDGTPKTVTADATGAYSIKVPFNWSGTLTPSKAGYFFSPGSASFSNLTAPQVIQNFTARVAYSISGNVGLPGLTLSYVVDSTTLTVTADDSGNYSFLIPSGWSGTITPSHTCFTFNPPNRVYSNVTSNQTAQNFTATFNSGSGCADINVLIGGNNVGHYAVPSEKSTFDRYKINNGPVKVSSTNALPIFTSQRAVFGSSFNSIVGYPANQLTTDYWFTSYDDVGMTTFLVIGNPSTSQTAQVDVYIGGVKRNATPYSIGPGQRIFPRFGINGGPVFVDGLNGVDIFTSQRTRFGDSFNEIMGYPANRLTTDYWFTSYDDVGMITYLVMGNPSTSQTAEVDVYISGTKRNSMPISIPPGQRVFLRYGVNGGPVFVDGLNGVNIFASERTRFGNTFNEVMGYPADQTHTEFWFTSYNDVGMITYLVIGNPSPSQTAQVDVYMDGVKRNNTVLSIAPGQRVFLRYGINSGPVRVVSTNGVNVFASERSKYLSSFNEILGMAGNQLTTDYWFTSYDDVGMTTYLVIAAP